MGGREGLCSGLGMILFRMVRVVIALNDPSMGFNWTNVKVGKWRCWLMKCFPPTSPPWLCLH